MKELTSDTVKLVERLFPPEQHTEVCDLLARECGNNLPLTGPPTNAHGHERIRFAAMKVSGGDLAKLREAVDHSKIDWRDVLVSAGFGNSVTAHQEWAGAILHESPPT
jgi:hypothetical protein